jgi:hypothetical protein
MLRGMRDQRRCCVATLGDGASTRPEIYDTLDASLIIWIGGLQSCCTRACRCTRHVFVCVLAR